LDGQRSAARWREISAAVRGRGPAAVKDGELEVASEHTTDIADGNGDSARGHRGGAAR
jgi:hypothetical protein